MPPGCINVTRTRAGMMADWANPFRIGRWFRRGDWNYRGPFRMTWSERFIWEPEDADRARREGYTLIADAAQAVEWFEWLTGTWSAAMLARCRAELGAHDLACWCPTDRPCHADILLRIANPGLHP